MFIAQKGTYIHSINTVMFVLAVFVSFIFLCYFSCCCCLSRTMFHYSNASHFIWWCFFVCAVDRIFYVVLNYTNFMLVKPTEREKKENRGTKLIGHCIVVPAIHVAEENEMLCWCQVNEISKQVNICFVASNNTVNSWYSTVWIETWTNQAILPQRIYHWHEQISKNIFLYCQVRFNHVIAFFWHLNFFDICFTISCYFTVNNNKKNHQTSYLVTQFSLN